MYPNLVEVAGIQQKQKNPLYFVFMSGFCSGKPENQSEIRQKNPTKSCQSKKK